MASSEGVVAPINMDNPMDGMLLIEKRYPVPQRCWRNRCALYLFLLLVLTVGFVLTAPVDAESFDIAGPIGSSAFGTGVYILPNGNIVVTDPHFSDGTNAELGVVYLYDPSGHVISTITGSHAYDQIGSGGVAILANGNYVIRSNYWGVVDSTTVGAVTWGSESSGVSGIVSASNSLVGVDDNVTPLSNGNYVVSSPYWDAGSASSVGAVTWCDGNGGTVGVVSTSNSLIGTSTNDHVGSSVTALTNGNYVVASPDWSNGAAAAAGAVTLGDGNGGTIGQVSAVNSLVGGATNDQVGYSVTALKNGNFVVASMYWSDGPTAAVGAATWGDGISGISGTISASNSLVGATAGDEIAYAGSQSSGYGITALSNGNYVVKSRFWHNGSAISVGAATWGDGKHGIVGHVSASNSVVGTTSDDEVGSVVTPLSNGNYVVSSFDWHNGAEANAGAATWGNGNGGTIGSVSANNSLVGTNAITNGIGVVTPLSNGNYVVSSSGWYNNSLAYAGAATWCDGNGGTIGMVSVSNSLVGTSAYDSVGTVRALTNGNYVVTSAKWSNGTLTHVGAVTWSNGNGGTAGPITAGNSIIGATAGEAVGSQGVTALSNGNFVASSPFWQNSAADSVGATTWGDGNGGTVGLVSESNSLVGTTTDDEVGYYRAFPLSNGDYVIVSPYWHNGTISGAGAVTLRRGTDRGGATISTANSVLGTVPLGGSSMHFVYDGSRDSLIVGKPAENIVTVFKADLLFRDGFE